MREHHNAEKPAKGSSSHQQRDKDGPPKDATPFFLFREAAAPVGAVLASVAQKSNMHGKFEKIIEKLWIEIR
jgi:hypothetical protein